MKIVVAQLNPTVGDVNGNIHKAQEVFEQACQQDADLVVFPELFLTGYPPQDLLSKSWLLQRVAVGLEMLKDLTQEQETGILIGAPIPNENRVGQGLYELSSRTLVILIVR